MLRVEFCVSIVQFSCVLFHLFFGKERIHPGNVQDLSTQGFSIRRGTVHLCFFVLHWPGVVEYSVSVVDLSWPVDRKQPLRVVVRSHFFLVLPTVI